MGRSVLRSGTGKWIGLGLIILLVSYSGWVTLWARQGEGLKPVTLGRDACATCGMIVSDLRFSISILDKDERSHSVTRHFDDVGCFLDFLNGEPHEQLIGVAHHFRTGAEIPIGLALYEKTKLHTPMGSGWIVSSNRAELKSHLELSAALAHALHLQMTKLERREKP